MKNNFLTIAIVTATTVAGISLFTLMSRNKPQTGVLSSLTESSSSTPRPTETSYTLEEVSRHSAPEDCWLAVEGVVYNVTPFIAESKHPGGAAILQGCGSDATALYNDRPNGSGPHSEQARSLLPQYRIGRLTLQTSE